VCQADEDPVNCPEDCDDDIPQLPEPWGTPGHWWILIHPNYPSMPGPGIHLVDTNTGNLIRSLPLPPEAESPHGLAAEAHRVWVSDMVSQKIYRLDPTDGTVIDTLSGGYTEGLAITATGYWSVYDDYSRVAIEHHLFSGGVSHSFEMNTNVVNDLAYDGEYVYYVINDGNDPIRRINVRTGARDFLVRHTIVAICTCAFDGEAVVIDTDFGYLRRYHPVTGDQIDEVEHGLDGWITAIAPAWGE
jgi:outer membrane protein assembly factor BamB